MDPVRNPGGVIASLAEACVTYPDQRVMQVIVNALGTDPFYVEDDEAIKALMAYSEKKNG